MPHDPSDVPLLIAEDSDDDFEGMIRTFRKVRLANPIYRCASGEELLDFLLKQGRYAKSELLPPPGVILLDLNMPGMDGRNALKAIKQNTAIKHIPVVVLSTSTNERDLSECYLNGANSFVVKPIDLDDFVTTLKKLISYWLETNILPDRSP